MLHAEFSVILVNATTVKLANPKGMKKVDRTSDSTSKNETGSSTIRALTRVQSIIKQLVFLNSWAQYR